MPRKTFKQRIRVNDMKQRHQAHSELRKRMRVGRKNHNREDAYIQNGRGMEELVQDVAEGSTIASRDTLDPRSLADLLMTRGADGRLSLSSQPLPANDPKALPEITKPDDDEAVRKMFEPKNNNDSANPNRYKHKGSPYVFWNNLGLHEAIVRALRDMKFTHPTPVQEETLPTVMEKPSNGIMKDNVVSAETGSGKTLVFAIPIIQALMAEMTKRGEEVLTPEGKMPYVKKGGNATTSESKSGTTEDKGKHTKKGGKPSTDNKNNKKNASSNEDVENKNDDDDDDEPLDEEIDEEDLNEEDLDEEMAEGEESEEAEEDEEAEELPLEEEEDEDEEEIQEKEIKKKKTAKGKASKRDRGAESDDDDGEKVKIVKKPYASPEQIAKTVMHTLIISPTRELALQIKLCMEELCRYTMIRIGCVVGGMAPTKQQRVLNKHPHILICTPGRLWELTQKNEGCYLGHSISRRLNYVVLDEADKLLQGGRFQDLKAILERVHSDILPSGLADSSKNKKDHYGDDVQKKENNNEEGSDLDGDIEEGEWDEATQSFVPKKTLNNTKSLNNTDVVTKKNKDSAKHMPYPDPPGKNHRVASFVTSATLSLQTNYTKKDLRGKRQVIRTSNASTMNQVLHELAIKQKHANIFDLAPETGIVSKIHETYLRCPEKAKDLYLYYFLRTYKDKTIIFVNAISMLRRLTKILEILGIPCVGLHAAMQQRQRLKFVDRFKSGDKQVLVATDIASRGLDVQGLRYVIHYQLPRSTDAYIHRCGRTARCGGTGLSLMMVDASEHTAFKKLHESLGRTQSQPMEVFALDPTVVHHLHPHLTVALQIDKLTREISKASANENWLQNMTKTAELDASDMMLDEETKLEHQAKMKAIRILKKRLEQMGKKDTGHRGGKGAFRTGAKAIGMKEAIQKTKERADRQVYKGHKY